MHITQRNDLDVVWFMVCHFANIQCCVLVQIVEMKVQEVCTQL